MPKWRRRALTLGAMCLVGIVVLKSFAEYTASRVAGDVCRWLNAGNSDEALPFTVGPQVEAMLLDLRQMGDHVECSRTTSPFADDFLTESAIAVRSANRETIGLRIGVGVHQPTVLGYWTM